jgi:lysyl-tRNA synthetase class 2
LRIEIAKEVFESYPNYRRYVVLAKGVDNSGKDEELEGMLREKEQAVRSCEDLSNYKEHPRILAWRKVFEDMNLNPNRFPPSIANLVKRVRSGKDLPFVNKLVCIFNIVSLKYIVPCGGDDLSVVRGTLLLGQAAGDETYNPLGKPQETETPAPGEIILYDTGTKDVFCRGWCWKNGDSSKITPETKVVAINIDAMMDVVPQEEHRRAAFEVAELVKSKCGGEVDVWLLSPEKRWLDIEF